MIVSEVQAAVKANVGKKMLDIRAGGQIMELLVYSRRRLYAVSIVYRPRRWDAAH